MSRVNTPQWLKATRVWPELTMARLKATRVDQGLGDGEEGLAELHSQP